MHKMDRLLRFFFQFFLLLIFSLFIFAVFLTKFIRGSRKMFCQSVSKSPTVTTLFQLMRVESYHIPIKAGHHRPASETSFKWRFAGGPMMAKHWRADDCPILNAGPIAL